ncbi:MAG: DUF1385 domain-containing protein [Candidatus Delongbacteria bacterium]|nr:DUF1385 domain-containing protein [Candidatus Delongbacteria bacterium]MBN2834791.1 DUF1385 domain-containing protein [Candidatus Delongbacteria bacterium]
MNRYAGLSHSFGIVLMEKNFGAVFAYKNRSGEFCSKFFKISRKYKSPILSTSYNYWLLMKLSILSTFHFIKNDFSKIEKLITLLFLVIQITLVAFLPYFISEISYDSSKISFVNEFMYNMIKTLVKLFFVLLFFYFIFKFGRTFLNHSAEHKIINCLEQKIDITKENIRNQSHLSSRCGTSFFLLNLIIGIFFFGILDSIIKTYFPVYPLIYRMIFHILISPIFISLMLLLNKGLSKLLFINSIFNIFIRFQKITLMEADDESIELAITSYKKLEKIKNNS